MKENTEVTKLERLRMLVGAFLAFLGLLTLTFASAVLLFSNAILTVAGILLILAGVLIAGSSRLAILVRELLGL